MRHQRVLGGLVVDPVAVVAFVQAREDLVRLVDDDQVERGTRAELLRAAFAAGELAADQVDTRSGEVRLGLLGLNPKQVEQLVLPLADQRLRDDEEDALGPFGAALRNHQAGFDRLPKPDFVGEDAATLSKASKREDHRVDLMWVRIDAGLPLRRGVALAVVGSADADEVLGQHAEVEGVQGHATCERTVLLVRVTNQLRFSRGWPSRLAFECFVRSLSPRPR